MSSVATIPEFNLEMDGEALPPEDAESLTEIRVHQGLSQPSLCELTFVASRGPMSALANTATGSHMRLTVPPGSALLFDGEVTAIEYTYEPTRGQVIRIRGYDLLHRLRKRQPVKVHVQVTPEDLARELVADLSLSVTADDPGPIIPRIIQHRQSDFELLVDAARRVGLFLSLRGNVLRLMTLDGSEEPIPLEYGTTLLEARIEVNGEHACRSVVARGWDTARVEQHEGTAQHARVGRDVLAEASPGAFGEAGERTLAGETFPDDRQAEAFAQGELDRRTAREVTFWGVTEGNPALMPGCRVKVSGIARNLEGSYVLTTVTHSFNHRTGFVSEISTVPPVFERGSVAAWAAWGVVTRVDDPENLGRVQASLPALGTVETGWMGVLAPGAGNGKGIVAMPDVGDQVLVLFVDGDPSQGIVLGGLYGAHGPEDYGVEGTSIRRYTLATPGGQKVRLDDTAQSIRIENKGGSFVELSPKRVIVHSTVDLQIDAPGRDVVITGKAIDFRRG